ncbi:1-phosphofructokinase family hexose kinase [uncultured Pseudokineococcus sp.]|uniref:1-phosphofructokinase family hexose kinase n=1 Tax=uncultured Pseudokineococcus sp. TaxID=1642928 RepID=UPI00261D40C6|nr:hexose kinase [uncultured Pseudokineococcus sp.]
MSAAAPVTGAGTAPEVVTLTANPSLDRTVDLAGPLRRGAVQRATASVVEPGGKGVNVARVLAAAGRDVVAVLPADAGDPLLAALAEAGLAARPTPAGGPVRTNTAVTEPDGTTTKVNEAGPLLTPGGHDALRGAVLDAATGARWAVLSGSLPPGAPASLYADLVAPLRAAGCAVGVDTSGAALAALLGPDADPAAAPDVVKPNGEELGELTGEDGDALEADPVAAARAARSLVERGVGAVLVTLGARGAVLVTAQGAWSALPPPVVPRSTVGAGDSALAGYVLATLRGDDAPGRLREAVAHGSAAAALPGSALPGPDQVRPDLVEITPLSLDPAPAPLSS